MAEIKKKVLIIVYSEIRRDARVLRQIEWLKNRFQITLFAYGGYSDPAVEYHQLHDNYPMYLKVWGALLLKLKLYNKYYWTIPVNREARDLYSRLNRAFDLIICNDVFPLPLAVQIKGQAKLIFDAHEYYPLEHDNSYKWMFFFHSYISYLCRVYAPQADLMFTVGQNIVAEYVRVFGLSPSLLLNLPAYQALSVQHVQGESVRLVHHGTALPGRNIEFMIEIVKALDDRFSLDLFLIFKNASYRTKLIECIGDNKRIRLYAPVDVNSLSAKLNAYDAGFYFLKSRSFNDINCLPNKFFDFIQARLAVIIGPSREMRDVVLEHAIGFVTSDFVIEHIVSELKGITKEHIYQCKINSDRLCREMNSERSKEILLDSISRLLQ